jgi:hypothetical protein
MRSIIRRVGALEEIIEAKRPWTPERFSKTLDDAARRIAGSRFDDLDSLEAQTVLEEVTSGISVEEFEGMMRQIEQRYGKTHEEMLELAEKYDALSY